MLSKEEKFSLWIMNPTEFNNWRSSNDLKLIYEYIYNKSELFRNWLKEFNLSLKEILQIHPSSKIFNDMEGNWFIIRSVKDGNHYSIVNNDSYKNNPELGVIKGVQFKSFFRWKDELHADETLLENSRGRKYKKIHIDTQMQSRFKVDDNSEINEISMLFGDIELLQLGAYKLEPYFNTLNRNLDFLNLNSLILSQSRPNFLGFSHLNVSNSTLNNILLDNVDANTFIIKHCTMHNLTIKDSNVDKLIIMNTQTSKSLILEKSRLYNFKIDSRFEKMFFYDSEVKNIEFSVELPKKNRHTHTKYYNHFVDLKTIRLNLESNFNSSEASKYYYLEKIAEINAKRFYIVNSAPKAKYAGPLIQILKMYFKKEYTFKNSIMYFKWRMGFIFNCTFNPKYNFKLLSIHVRTLRLRAERILWGFGEKPFRLLFNVLVLLSVFTALYFFSNEPNLSRNILNSMYFSVITFSTLGYGDIAPTIGITKLITSIEALTGVFFMGLILASFINKSRK